MAVPSTLIYSELDIPAYVLSNMTTENNGGSAIRQLCPGSKVISSANYGHTSSHQSPADLLLNTTVRPKNKLKSISDHSLTPSAG
jgi:hypothetical protein